MARILTIVDWYLPAFKAGGPVRSISNMVAALGGDEFEFFVLTRDRDLGDTTPYPGAPINSWAPVGNAQVMYLADLSLGNLKRQIAALKPDVIYLNSVFSIISIKVMLLLRLGLLGKCPVIVAPRGELSPGALGIKSGKKTLFLRFAGLAGLYRNVLWHASAARESEEIAETLRAFRLDKPANLGGGATFHVASNIPGGLPDAAVGRLVEKRPGQASFLFVSRVSPKKNLAMAIEALAPVRGEVTYDIYGPVDDANYWQHCEELIQQAPKNVEIRHLGALPHEKARQKFGEYHFFLFPTLSENFGHVIVESLSGGCPVIVSDQTPWLGLESKNIGWDLPLNDRQRWTEVLQTCVDMDGNTYRNMSKNSLDYVREWMRSPKIRTESVNLFRRALGQDGQTSEGEGGA